MTVRLRIVQGRPRGKYLLFDRGEYVFGRGVECHVRPNSEWVSRQHCLLRVTRDGVLIRDLGSLNGTLLNGVRLMQERNLSHGDLVEVGPLVFEVRLDPLPEQAGKSAEEPLPHNFGEEPPSNPELPPTRPFPTL